MPQIDHRVGEGFERVVQRTEALEAQQQTLELVFPGEHALDGAKALFEDGGIEQRFAAALLQIDQARGEARHSTDCGFFWALNLSGTRSPSTIAVLVMNYAKI